MRVTISPPDDFTPQAPFDCKRSGLHGRFETQLRSNYRTDERDVFPVILQRTEGALLRPLRPGMCRTDGYLTSKSMVNKPCNTVPLLAKSTGLWSVVAVDRNWLLGMTRDVTRQRYSCHCQELPNPSGDGPRSIETLRAASTDHFHCSSRLLSE